MFHSYIIAVSSVNKWCIKIKPKETNDAGKKSCRFMDLFNLLFIQTQKGNLIAQYTHKYFHPIIQIQYYTVPEQTPSKLKKLKKIGGGTCTKPQ